MTLINKSEFKSEQIDSPSTSRNLENYDRDSEEWEELSNKDNKASRKWSPENQTKDNMLNVNSNLDVKNVKPTIKKKSNKKIIIINSNKKKIYNQGFRFRADKVPKQIFTNKDEHYLAVGPGSKPIPQRKKSKIYAENRQFTSKTDDVYFRDGGEYIRKITQRTNTKISNFSEFPTPIQEEKQVKLNQTKENTFSKFRSRTVKKKNKNLSRLRSKVSPK